MEKRMSAKGFIFLKPTELKENSTYEEFQYFYAENSFCKWANGLDFRTIRYMIEHSMPLPVYAEEIGYTGHYHRFFTYDKLLTRIARSTHDKVNGDFITDIMSLDGIDLLQELVSSRMERGTVVQDEEDSQTIHFDRYLTEEEIQEFRNELDRPFIEKQIQ